MVSKLYIDMPLRSLQLIININWLDRKLIKNTIKLFLFSAQISSQSYGKQLIYRWPKCCVWQLPGFLSIKITQSTWRWRMLTTTLQAQFLQIEIDLRWTEHYFSVFTTWFCHPYSSTIILFLLVFSPYTYTFTATATLFPWVWPPMYSKLAYSIRHLTNYFSSIRFPLSFLHRNCKPLWLFLFYNMYCIHDFVKTLYKLS